MLNQLQSIRKSILAAEDFSRIVGFNEKRHIAAQLVDGVWAQHEHDMFEVRLLFHREGGAIDHSRFDDIHITLPHQAHRGVAPVEFNRLASMLISGHTLSFQYANNPPCLFLLDSIPGKGVSTTEFTFPAQALTSYLTLPGQDGEHLRLVLAMCLSILSRLLECSTAQEASPADAIAAYIRANYSRRTLSVGEIAEVHGFSPNYIQRVFRAKWDCTLIEYINRIRLHSARLLLRQHRWQIRHVARMCGFSYVHYFSKRYRQYFGILPGEE